MSLLTCLDLYRRGRAVEGLSDKQRNKLRENMIKAVGNWTGDAELIKTDYATDIETMKWMFKKATGKEMNFEMNPITNADIRKFNMRIKGFSRTVAKKGKGWMDWFKVPKAIMRKFPELMEFQENLSHEAGFYRKNQLANKVRVDNIIDGWTYLAKVTGGDRKKLRRLEGELARELEKPYGLQDKPAINSKEKEIQEFMAEGASIGFRDFNSLMNGLDVEQLKESEARYTEGDMKVWRDVNNNMKHIRNDGVMILSRAIEKVIKTARTMESRGMGPRNVESVISDAAKMIKALEFQEHIDVEGQPRTYEGMKAFENMETIFGLRKGHNLEQRKYMPLYVIGATKLFRQIDLAMRNDANTDKDLRDILSGDIEAFRKQTTRIMSRGNIEDARYTVDPAYFLRKYIHDISSFTFTTHLENNYWQQTAKLLDMHSKGAAEDNKDVMELADSMIRQMNEMKDSLIHVDPSNDNMINDLSRILTSFTYVRLMGGNLRSAARNATQRFYEFIEFGYFGRRAGLAWLKESTDNAALLAVQARRFGLSWFINEGGGIFGKSRNLPIEQQTRGAVEAASNVPKGYEQNELGELVRVSPGRGVSEFTRKAADLSSKVAGISGIAHRVVEDWNRAGTFKIAFALNYKNLLKAPDSWIIAQMNRNRKPSQKINNPSGKQIRAFKANKAGRMAYNMTTDLHFDYARWAKAKPFKGPAGQVVGQFMHYRMSMFDLMHKWAKDAGISMLAGDFTSQESWKAYRFGMLQAMIWGTGTAFNMNFQQLAQNDVVESMSNLMTFFMADRDNPKEKAELEKATYGQGAWSFAGPNILYAANLGEVMGLWQMGDNSLMKNDRVVQGSEQFTREQKYKSRALISSQYARFSMYTLPVLIQRGLWDAARLELGLFPKGKSRGWLLDRARKHLPYETRKAMGLDKWRRGFTKQKYPIAGPRMNPMSGKYLSPMEAKRVLGDIDYIRGKATPAQVLGKSSKRTNKLSPEAYNANVLKSLSFMDTL